jgi:hypothetical protein
MKLTISPFGTQLTLFDVPLFGCYRELSGRNAYAIKSPSLTLPARPAGLQ